MGASKCWGATDSCTQLSVFDSSAPEKQLLILYPVISSGKIKEVGKNMEVSRVRRVIDARDMAVAPGFVDTHSHDDVYLVSNPKCDDKILQGVTTDVIGNCGVFACGGSRTC